MDTVAVVEEREKSNDLVEEDNERNLVVTWKCTRLLLGWNAYYNYLL